MRPFLMRCLTRVSLVAGGLAMAIAAPARADGVDRYLRAQLQERGIPGMSVAVLRHGKVLKLRGYGLADVEHQVPATGETVFPVASITKIFTSAAILRLADEGKLRLDQPIGKILTDLPESWRRVTVRNCLSHTSGLPDSWTLDHQLWQRPQDWQALRALTFEAPLEFPAGTRCSYNQTGFQMLGEIVEKLSGTSFEAFVQRTILGPAGMRSARFNRYSSARGNSYLTPVVPRLAPCYVRENGELQHAAFYRPVWDQPTGGLLLSLQDLVRWEQAVMQGNILRPSSLEAAWTPSTLADGGVARLWSGSYGLGWFVGEHRGRRFVGHVGSNSAWYGRFPNEGLAVIILTNLETSNPLEMALRVADHYLPGERKQATRDRNRHGGGPTDLRALPAGGSGRVARQPGPTRRVAGTGSSFRWESPERSICHDTSYLEELRRHGRTMGYHTARFRLISGQEL